MDKVNGRHNLSFFTNIVNSLEKIKFIQYLGYFLIYYKNSVMLILNTDFIKKTLEFTFVANIY